jgi:hypothetical protein
LIVAAGCVKTGNMVEAVLLLFTTVCEAIDGQKLLQAQLALISIERLAHMNLSSGG